MSGFSKKSGEAFYSIGLAVIVTSLFVGIVGLGLPITSVPLLVSLGADHQIAMGTMGNVLLIFFACYLFALVMIVWRLRRFEDLFVYSLLAVPGLNLWAWDKIKQRRTATVPSPTQQPRFTGMGGISRRSGEAFYSLCLAVILTSLWSSLFVLVIPFASVWLLVPLGASRQLVLVTMGAVLLLFSACYLFSLVMIAWRVRRFDDMLIYSLLAIPGVDIWVWGKIKQRRTGLR